VSNQPPANKNKESDKRMIQTMFNIEELLQIFSSASCNASRRRPKAGAYLSLHDSFIS
jgi:hypothetical protein